MAQSLFSDFAPAPMSPGQLGSLALDRYGKDIGMVEGAANLGLRRSQFNAIQAAQKQRLLAEQGWRHEATMADLTMASAKARREKAKLDLEAKKNKAFLDAMKAAGVDEGGGGGDLPASGGALSDLGTGAGPVSPTQGNFFGGMLGRELPAPPVGLGPGMNSNGMMGISPPPDTDTAEEPPSVFPLPEPEVTPPPGTTLPGPGALPNGQVGLAPPPPPPPPNVWAPPRQVGRAIRRGVEALFPALTDPANQPAPTTNTPASSGWAFRRPPAATPPPPAPPVPVEAGRLLDRLSPDTEGQPGGLRGGGITGQPGAWWNPAEIMAPPAAAPVTPTPSPLDTHDDTAYEYGAGLTARALGDAERSILGRPAIGPQGRVPAQPPPIPGLLPGLVGTRGDRGPEEDWTQGPAGPASSLATESMTPTSTLDQDLAAARGLDAPLPSRRLDRDMALAAQPGIGPAPTPIEGGFPSNTDLLAGTPLAPDPAADLARGADMATLRGNLEGRQRVADFDAAPPSPLTTQALAERDAQAAGLQQDLAQPPPLAGYPVRAGGVNVAPTGYIQGTIPGRANAAGGANVTPRPLGPGGQVGGTTDMGLDESNPLYAQARAANAARRAAAPTTGAATDPEARVRRLDAAIQAIDESGIELRGSRLAQYQRLVRERDNADNGVFRAEATTTLRPFRSAIDRAATVRSENPADLTQAITTALADAYDAAETLRPRNREQATAMDRSLANLQTRARGHLTSDAQRRQFDESMALRRQVAEERDARREEGETRLGQVGVFISRFTRGRTGGQSVYTDEVNGEIDRFNRSLTANGEPPLSAREVQSIHSALRSRQRAAGAESGNF